MDPLMISEGPESPRLQAHYLVYEALESDDEQKILGLCRQALETYPFCVDAIMILADFECRTVPDYIEAMRTAVEAALFDLGPEYMEENIGEFWLDIETRPFMRALAGLADALLQWGYVEHVEEAISIYEDMLAFNPHDNQGVRFPLVGCYLQRKYYEPAAMLLQRYPEDWMATTCWAKVLLAYATGDENQAAALLETARSQNAYVELYLTGRQRRPRTHPDYYSPGDDSEAVICANTLWEAWKKHPKAKRWLKALCSAD